MYLFDWELFNRCAASQQNQHLSCVPTQMKLEKKKL